MKSLTHASHLYQRDQGENLMGGPCMKMAADGRSTRGYTLMEAAEDATGMWYNEVKDFNWGDYRSHRGVVGHFTQVKAASVLSPLLTLPIYVVDIELMEICHRMFQNALVYFFLSPNGEMVNPSNQIQLLQHKMQRQATKRIQLLRLQIQKLHLWP